MTGMEHAIEQVARVLIAHPSIPNHKDAIRDICPSCPDADVAGPNSPSHAAHQARALADAGLLAPAPLREEWGLLHPSGNTDMRRDRAHAESGVGNGWAVARRYVSDWLPVDRAEGDGKDGQ